MGLGGTLVGSRVLVNDDEHSGLGSARTGDDGVSSCEDYCPLDPLAIKHGSKSQLFREPGTALIKESDLIASGPDHVVTNS